MKKECNACEIECSELKPYIGEHSVLWLCPSCWKEFTDADNGEVSISKKRPS